MITMPIELYTDGSSLKNPGASGLGYIIRYWETAPGNDNIPAPNIIEGSQGFRLSTNNRMELMAGIYGLDEIIKKLQDGSFQGASQINLTSDSKYFCDAINQKWIQRWQQHNWMTSGFKGSTPQPVKNQDLWEQIISIQDRLAGLGVALVLFHIPGHNGHEFNERADKLAVAASTGNAHIIDEMYERTTNVKNRN